MKSILIMMDSLNRHYLSSYGNPGVNTPHLDRLAAKGIVFDRHYSGSLPCMPARRELMTGRLNFMESRWCPLQPFDEAYPEELRRQLGVYSHLITDHYHYFEAQGAGYHTPFNTWEFVRGQEGDPWHPGVREPQIPEFLGKSKRQDWVNRERMDAEREEEYPTPQCFERAIRFLERNHMEDRWHLQLEVFDPHEPFMCPAKYRELYNDNWDDRYHFDWPAYAPVDADKEGDAAIRHIRACYAGTLTMADAWLGKLLDTMDALDLWRDTAVILTTDHGHLLGEHGYWAKNYMFDYQELVHIPLIAYVPGAPMNGKRVGGLTSTIDIMPTLLQLHGAVPSRYVHGRSFDGLFAEDGSHHEAILYGYFGKDINLTDGRYTYCRQPVPGSVAYHHTATPPRASAGAGGMAAYDMCEVGPFLPQTVMPVYRFPAPSQPHHNATHEPLLYDLATDPNQNSPIQDAALHAHYEAQLSEWMRRYEAPEWQYTRVGLREE